jgi:hypothetical protein
MAVLYGVWRGVPAANVATLWTCCQGQQLLFVLLIMLISCGADYAAVLARCVLRASMQPGSLTRPMVSG